MSAIRVLRTIDLTTVAVAVLSILGTFALRVLIRSLGIFIHDTWWFGPVVISTVLIGYHFQKRFSAKRRVGYVGFLVAVIIIFQFHHIRLVYGLIQNMPEQTWDWDFQVFWLNGQVASAGQNFYIPENYYAVAKDLSPSDYFKEQILDVGFWYPPQTMFLFLPLGWLHMKTAAIFWALFLYVFLVTDVFLLWQIFLPRSGFLGLALVATMLSVMASTRLVILNAQTVFLLLFFNLLFLHFRQLAISGLWLVAAAITKPFVIVLSLLLILRRRWKPVIIAIIAAVSITALSVIVFGSDTILTYLSNSPTTRIPDRAYFFVENQSLLAYILRTTGVDSTGHSIVLQPLFLLAAACLGGITLILSIVLREEHDHWIVGLLVTFSLMVYPGNLHFYSLLLIIPFMTLWKHREDLPVGVWGIITFITLEYLLLGLEEPHTDSVLLSNFLCWLVLVGISCWLIITSRKSLLISPVET